MDATVKSKSCVVLLYDLTQGDADCIVLTVCVADAGLCEEPN